MSWHLQASKICVDLDNWENLPETTKYYIKLYFETASRLAYEECQLHSKEGNSDEIAASYVADAGSWKLVHPDPYKPNDIPLEIYDQKKKEVKGWIMKLLEHHLTCVLPEKLKD